MYSSAKGYKDHGAVHHYYPGTDTAGGNEEGKSIQESHGQAEHRDELRSSRRVALEQSQELGIGHLGFCFEKRGLRRV